MAQHGGGKLNLSQRTFKAINTYRTEDDAGSGPQRGTEHFAEHESEQEGSDHAGHGRGDSA